MNGKTQTPAQWNLNEVGIFEVNFDTGTVYWSREMRRMLGVSADAPAEFDLLLRLIHPQDRREFGAMFARNFQPDCPRYSMIEPRVVLRNGEIVRFHIEVVRVFSGDEKAPAVQRVAGFMIKAAAAPVSLEYALDVLSRAA